MVPQKPAHLLPMQLGMDGFIAKDFRSLGDFLGLRELLPLLGRVSVAELLGQHYSRQVTQCLNM